MKVYSFEKLEVWQHARKLTVWIYTITRKFPTVEKEVIYRQGRDLIERQTFLIAQLRKSQEKIK